MTIIPITILQSAIFLKMHCRAQKRQLRLQRMQSEVGGKALLRKLLSGLQKWGLKPCRGRAWIGWEDSRLK